MRNSERKGLVGSEDGYEQGADTVRGEVLHEGELELPGLGRISNAKMDEVRRRFRQYLAESAQAKAAGARQRAAELDSVIDRIQAELMTPGRLENATTGQALRLHEALVKRYEAAMAAVERAIETADKLAGG